MLLWSSLLVCEATGLWCVPNDAHTCATGMQAALGDPVQSTLDTRLWGHVTIDMRKCKSCKMCAAFCPTGALPLCPDQILRKMTPQIHSGEVQPAIKSAADQHISNIGLVVNLVA